MLITWNAFELHPNGLDYDLKMMNLPVDANEYIKHIWKRLEKIANENDIPLEFPSALSKSGLALEATEYALIQPEKYEKFHDLMFKAYFVDKQDIEKKKIILEVAEKVGLNSRELEESLESGMYKKVVTQSKQNAMLYGISAVPAFIVGTKKKMLFSGCQPINVFKEIFEQVYKKNLPS